MAKSLVRNPTLERRHFQNRVILMGAILGMCSVILLARIVYLQYYQGSLYWTLSVKNQQAVIPKPPARGIIYDRNGVVLADNKPVYSLEVIPQRVSHLTQQVRAMQRIILLTDEEIAAFYKQLKRSRPFTPVPLHWDLTDKERALIAVNLYRFPGFKIAARLIRHYPKHDITAHILGYVGRINTRDLNYQDTSNYAGTNFIGKVGIEKFYEPLLHGQTGYRVVETDASGEIVRTLAEKDATQGAHLTLTVDSRLQEKALLALSGLRGSVVAIDPQNGEVLTMVSAPSFDPNLFVTGISQTLFKSLYQSHTQPLYNRAIRGQYPMASTIKPFLALMALDSGIISRHYRIWDPGWYRLNEHSHKYRDWLPTGHGWITLERAIVVSCDTYFYNLAKLLGIARIKAILWHFGFGQLTGIDLAEELAGLVPDPQWKRLHKGSDWYTGDTLITGIGQGFMLSTPLQLASAVASLANRGQRYRPHLLKSTSSQEQVTPVQPFELFPIECRHPASWETIIRSMQQVIRSLEGTGFRFGRQTGYSIAGKTGTAQVFTAKKRHYIHMETLPERLRDHSLFIAFAPVHHPKIAVAVVVEHSNQAARVARQVIDFYLQHGDRKRFA